MQGNGNFTVYKSSAGSGKTYTLVREYITIALKSPRYFKSILAITFTNKAAAEMKQRIIISLTHMANPQKYTDTAAVKFMMPDIAKATGFSVNEIAEKSTQTLTQILHHYDDFAIKTIDSFVSNIIRTFAHDLHLPVDFEIELTHEKLLDEAVGKILDKIGVDKEITELLLAYADAKMEDDLSWDIELNLKQTGKEIFEERSIPFLAALKNYSPQRIKEISQHIRARLKHIENHLLQLAKNALTIINQQGVSPEWLMYGKNGIYSFFNRLHNKQIVLPSDKIATSVSENKWYASKCTVSQKLAVDAVKNELEVIFKDIVDYLNKNFSEYNLLLLISRNVYQMGVLAELQQQVEAISRENAVVHISEFNKRIIDIILKEPVPFIYERIGERYHHYLIDEFQDTSELQWKNLLPLLGETLAGGNFNLVVGDGKQAIYRFRNGNVEQFVTLPQLPPSFEKHIFAETADALAANYVGNELLTNFRSKQEIVNFNNALFTYAARFLPDDFKSIYANHVQKNLPSNNGGFVQIEFYEKEPKVKVPQVYLQRVADIIKQLQEKGFALGDICILIQKKLEGSIIARFLTQQGIKVVSNEALLLHSSPQVNFLISLLTYLKDKNMLAAAEILNYLNRNALINVDLIDVCSDKSVSGLGVFLAEQDFNFNEKYLHTFSLYDLCEELIRIFKLQTPYDIYLQTFLDFVNTVQVKAGNRIASFLQEWEENKSTLSIQSSAEPDAVKIMTIHKSKGLEFPVVILPVSQNDKAPLKNKWAYMPQHMHNLLPVAYLPLTKTWENTELAHLYTREQEYELLDKINAAYVACTRAVDCLYILCIEQNPTKESESFSFNKLFYNYTQENKGVFNESGNIFYTGIINQRKQRDELPEKAAQPARMQSSPWRQKIFIARTASAGISTSDSRTEQSWGAIVHESIALINSPVHIKDIVLQQAEKYRFSEQEKDKLTENLKKLVNNSSLTAYFGETVRTFSEAGILDTDGNAFRPDRVVFTDEGVVLIEFKTGIPLPQHKRQVHTYADLLVQMGYTIKEKILVYLSDDITIEKL